MNWLDGALPPELAITVAIGVTCWLGLGVVVSWIGRAPIQSRFAGRAAIALAAGWAILTVVPLPRWAPWSAPSTQQSTAATTLASPPIGTGIAEGEPRPAGEPALDLDPQVVAPHVAPTRPTLPRPATARAPLIEPVAAAWWSTDLTHWAVAGWTLGGLITVVWLLSGMLRLALALRRTKPAPTELLRLWRSLPDPTPRRAQVRLGVTGSGPYTAGLWRRTVVIPADLVAPNRREALRHVLLHERAHLHAGDVAGQWLTALAMPLLWPHPLFWYLRNRARLAAELLADDAAARQSGATAYVHSLIDLASRRTIAAPAVALPMARTPSEFYRRMETLMNRNTPLRQRASRTHRMAQTAAAALLFVGGVVTFGTELRAQSPELREIRQEVEKLRAENDSLRVQLEALRKALQERFVKDWRETAKNSWRGLLVGPEAVDVAETESATVDPVLADVTALEIFDVVDTAPDKTVTADPVLVDTTPESVEFVTEVIEAAFPETRSGPPTTAPTTAPLQPVLDTATLDLITRCLDQRAQLELAMVKLELAEEAAGKHVISTLDLRTAKVEAEAAERKFALLRSALDAEREATAAAVERCTVRVEQTRMRFEAGRVSADHLEPFAAELRWLQARLRLLEQAR